MTDLQPEVLDYYDSEISNLISEKYGYSQMDALRKFLNSQSCAMLQNPELKMWEFSPAVIFDMWEAEAVTGNPRNSVYFRTDYE